MNASPDSSQTHRPVERMGSCWEVKCLSSSLWSCCALLCDMISSLFVKRSEKSVHREGKKQCCMKSSTMPSVFHSLLHNTYAVQPGNSTSQPTSPKLLAPFRALSLLKCFLFPSKALIFLLPLTPGNFSFHWSLIDGRAFFLPLVIDAGAPYLPLTTDAWRFCASLTTNAGSSLLLSSWTLG